MPAYFGNESVWLLYGPYDTPLSVNLGQKLILILIGSLSKTTDCVYGSKLSILLHRVLQSPLFSCNELGNRKILEVSEVTNGSIVDLTFFIPSSKSLLNFIFLEL